MGVCLACSSAPSAGVRGVWGEQVESIKKVSEFVSQLRRVGKGHGTYQWDQDLMATLA